MIAIDWKPDEKILRKFGISMLILCTLFSGVLWLKGYPLAAVVFCGLAAYCGVMTLLCKPALRPLYGFWMAVAWLLGKIISPLVLGLVYYGVITPIGLVLKMTGHDKLRLKKPDGVSHWILIPDRVETSERTHERQF